MHIHLHAERITTTQHWRMSEDFFRKICTSHFIVRVRKGCVGFYCERELETEQNCNILTPHSYGRQRCVFLVLQGCSTGSPALCWLSLLHLITNCSPKLHRGSRGPLRPSVAFPTTSYQQLLWSPTQSGAPRAPSAWCGFPYHISSNSVQSPTELYNSSTPTQSLEWHVWSSSSGNNCHAVHRSLSSGASVYECTMGFFTLSHFISQIHPCNLFQLLAIGMCHFLPVHHFGMACLPGPKVKIQQYQHSPSNGVGCHQQVIDHVSVWSIQQNKTGFLSCCGCVNTTAWMHHMDPNKM